MNSPDRNKPVSRRFFGRSRIALVVVLTATVLIALDGEALGELLVLALVVLAFLYWPARKRARLSQVQETPHKIDRFEPAARAIVEAFAEPVLVVDRDLTLQYQNPASIGPLGRLAVNEAIALRFRAPHVLATIEDAVQSNKRTSTLLDERRGVERSFKIEVLPVGGGRTARPSIFLIVFYDRTAMQATERIRTDFVANASHELRTPLASLVGFIETLQGPARGDPEARDRFLDIMREQAGRMSRLIDDLLSLSRIEMKRHLPVSEPIDLADVLLEVADQLAFLAEERDVALKTEIGDEPMFVAGDRDELIQVFSNLVENACKYGASGERVVLGLQEREERGRTVIDASVTDFGPGIPEEHVPRLTERFYRVDVGSSRAMKGTGLGLAIVRNILLRHKARLLIESKPGHGSTFTARFPRLEGQGAGSGESLVDQGLGLS